MKLQKWMPEWGKMSPWAPFSDIMDIQQEMNRLFDLFFGRIPFKGTTTEARAWAPALDVYETKDEVVVRAEIPGIEIKDIQVMVVDDNLTIKGERRREEEAKEEDYRRLERNYGAFARVITLPAKIDADKVKASYKDGILEIRLPKVEGAKPKEIRIETN